ncbi:MAG: ABC transporter permease, partial [Armatimonadetes bacterium]|nr:ABC transporter permease [Armatimonadota bacterium]
MMPAALAPDIPSRRDPIRTALMVFLGLVVVFMLAPIAFVLVYAFSSVSYAIFPPPGFSMRWFVKLFQQEPLFRAAVNSLIVAAMAMVVSLVAGTLASLALVRYRFFGRELLRAVFLAPLIVPRIAFGVAMLVYVVLLRRFGGLDSLILAHLMLTLPFAITILSATLVAADRSLEEAAMDLGANGPLTFWRVTLPLMVPGLAAAALFAFTVSLDEFIITFLLTGSTQTLPLFVWGMLRTMLPPTVNAVATVIVVVSILLILLVMGIQWRV